MFEYFREAVQAVFFVRDRFFTAIGSHLFFQRRLTPFGAFMRVESLLLIRTIIVSNESNSQSKLPAATADNKCNQTTTKFLENRDNYLWALKLRLRVYLAVCYVSIELNETKEGRLFKVEEIDLCDLLESMFHH